MEALQIYLDHISKTFVHRVKGRITAVDDVELEVHPGELLTLLGPSGCGKTTTLRMVAGFEKPSQGRIFLGREDVTELMVNQRTLGFVFQNYALFPHLSVFENVAYGLKVKHMPATQVRTSVEEILSMVGLRGYEDQFPNQLSGGEQQRVALARAVVIRPRVLLFDEPLSNLDAKLRVRTRSEIRRLQKTLQITAIYVTHDQEEAMAISDRIAVMSRGKIIQIGTAEELYFKPRSEFVAKFIGKTNTLPAANPTVSSDSLSLDIFGHTYRVAPLDPQVQNVADMKVYIRPEMVQLTTDPHAGHFSARIVERSFLGGSVEYVLEAEGQRFAANAQSQSMQGTFALQQTVGVRLYTDHLILLAEEKEKS